MLKPERSYLPQKFEFCLGGFNSLGFGWKLHGRKLESFNDCGVIHDPQHVVEPSAEAWQNFWIEMERIGVWRWESEYVDLNILDGTQWTLRMRFGKLRLQSSGSNAYPGGQGLSYSPESSFGLFVAALEQLTAYPRKPGALKWHTPRRPK